jgi:UDP-glucuronate 4-epimerase
MKRDFTYVTDIVSGILASLDKNYPYEIFNLGNSESVDLLRFIGCIEKELGTSATKKMLPMRPGDVPETYADIEFSREKLGFNPQVKIEQGIHEFVKWYKDYFKAK